MHRNHTDFFESEHLWAITINKFAWISELKYIKLKYEFTKTCVINSICNLYIGANCKRHIALTSIVYSTFEATVKLQSINNYWYTWCTNFFFTSKHFCVVTLSYYPHKQFIILLSNTNKHPHKIMFMTDWLIHYFANTRHHLSLVACNESNATTTSVSLTTAFTPQLPQRFEAKDDFKNS